MGLPRELGLQGGLECDPHSRPVSHQLALTNVYAEHDMKFVQYRDSKGEFRWRLKADNGKVIADSGEGYKNEADCNSAVSLVMDTDRKTPYVRE